MTKNTRRVHKAGKTSGYETDGESYWLAPMFKDQFDALIDEHEAINSLVAVIQSHAADRFASINKRKRALWNRVLEDLGIERGSGVMYSYSYNDGRISPTGGKLEPEQEPEA